MEKDSDYEMIHKQMIEGQMTDRSNLPPIILP